LRTCRRTLRMSACWGKPDVIDGGSKATRNGANGTCRPTLRDVRFPGAKRKTYARIELFPVLMLWTAPSNRQRECHGCGRCLRAPTIQRSYPCKTVYDNRSRHRQVGLFRFMALIWPPGRWVIRRQLKRRPGPGVFFQKTTRPVPDWHRGLPPRLTTGRGELQVLGHTVRLMPPAYVKPYVKRQKNDAADAEAICGRPSARSQHAVRANQDA